MSPLRESPVGLKSHMTLVMELAPSELHWPCLVDGVLP